MMLSKIVVASAIGLMLAACADLQENPKTTGGSLVGAAVGGLAGAQFGGGSGRLATTAAGVLLGTLLGSEAGKSLDRADRLAMQQTTLNTLDRSPSGQAVPWRNPDTGNYGTVVPLRTYESAQTYCREYQQTVTVGGRTRQAYGTACRQPDGSWRVVDS
jgi:surface antigen